AEKIVRSGLKFVGLSLDSVEPFIHNKSRGVSGVHKKVLRSIDELKKVRDGNPHIFINSLIMKKNLKELFKLVKLADNKNIEGITFQPIAPPDLFGSKYKRPYLNNFYQKISDMMPNKIEGFISKFFNDIYEKKNREWFSKTDFWPNYENVEFVLDEIVKMKKNGYPVGNSFKDLNRFYDYFKDPLKFLEQYECVACDSLTITKNGKIKLCPKSSILGDINKDNLFESLNRAKAEKVRRQIKNCRRTCKILSINKDDFYF
ncbi:MAG: hypothetical protein ABEK36_00315, partial [Candidatus Aenigmatarchaeota archaeon]